MNQENPTRKPLEGIRVIDFSMFMAGPYCGRYLADLGADVIKVEPLEGDNFRTNGPFRAGVSSYFGHINVGKRSIVLDLKDKDDQDRALALTSDADIVLENGRPGTMKRLGLDFETLSKINPGLIYCSISGFGQDGPKSDAPAFAQTVHAACGYDLTFTRYQDGEGRPPNTGIFTADVIAGVYAFSGVLTALYDRQRTGKGQFIDLAMVDSMMNLLAYEFQEAQFPIPERRHVYKPMRTTDGYVMIGLISPRNFNSLFDLMGRPEWKTHEIYGNVVGRTKNWDVLMAEIELWTATRSSSVCEAEVGAVGIPVTRYYTVKEAMEDPQFAFRSSFSSVKDAVGEFLVPNLPFKLSGSNIRPGARAPAKGEHRDEILREITSRAKQ